MYTYILLLLLLALWSYHLKETFISSTILDTTGEPFGFKVNGEVCLGEKDDIWCFKDNNQEFTVVKNNSLNQPDSAHFIVNGNGDLWVNKSTYRGWIGGKLKENKDFADNLVDKSVGKKMSVRISNTRRAEDKQCSNFKNQDGGLVFSCDNYDWEAFRFLD